jgi:hypothetical protein
MDYKPYTTEWHRKRQLRDAIFTYLDDYVSNDIILGDITDILSERSERAYAEFAQANELESMIHSR